MSSTKIIRSFEEEIRELRQRLARLEEGPAKRIQAFYRRYIKRKRKRIRDYEIDAPPAKRFDLSSGERFTFSHYDVHTGEWVFLSDNGTRSSTLTFHRDLGCKCAYFGSYYYYYRPIKDGDTYKLLTEHPTKEYVCANITLHNVPACLEERFKH